MSAVIIFLIFFLILLLILIQIISPGSGTGGNSPAHDGFSGIGIGGTSSAPSFSILDPIVTTPPTFTPSPYVTGWGGANGSSSIPTPSVPTPLQNYNNYQNATHTTNSSGGRPSYSSSYANPNFASGCPSGAGRPKVPLWVRHDGAQRLENSGRLPYGGKWVNGKVVGGYTSLANYRYAIKKQIKLRNRNELHKLHKAGHRWKSRWGAQLLLRRMAKHRAGRG